MNTKFQETKIGTTTYSVYVCFCYWPPVRAMCLNHEVVVLQPCTVTPLDLGSVANAQHLLYTSQPTCSKCVQDLRSPSPPPDLSSIAPPSFTRQRRLYISLHPLLLPPPPISPGRGAILHLDGAPACRPPPLVRTSLTFQASQGVSFTSL